MKDIIYVNNNVLGYFEKETYLQYSKTEKENQAYEKVFSAKKIIITPIIMTICFAFFALGIYFEGFGGLIGLSSATGLKIGASWLPLVKAGQVWRLVSAIFVHWSLVHLLLNMYTLFIIGTQIETFLGKIKYLIIFLVGGICGSLLSCVVNGAGMASAGASAAIRTVSALDYPLLSSL